MIAKLIVHAETRDGAIDRLADVLGRTGVWPVKTNATFVRRAILTDEFRSGRIDTGLIGRNETELAARPVIPSTRDLETAANVLSVTARPKGPVTAMDALFNWRLNSDRAEIIRLDVDGAPIDVEIGQVTFKRMAEALSSSQGWHVPSYIFLTGAGTTFKVQVYRPRGTGTTHGLHDGEIEAPMPGKVTAVEVSKGDKVAKGERLLTLEAMKMEHALTAPFDGTVAELAASPGAQVTEGQLLVKVEPAPAE
jgi:3-methylcrotonyl-CoA carboxylase alpha subunit